MVYSGTTWLTGVWQWSRPCRRRRQWTLHHRSQWRREDDVKLSGHWRLFVLVSSFYIFSGYVC